LLQVVVLANLQSIPRYTAQWNPRSVLQPHEFWQELHPPGTFGPVLTHIDRYPVTLPDGRQLLLPIRPLPDGERALVSLIINQASFPVQDALARHLVASMPERQPEIVVGLPTLGLTLAAAVAQRLGHSRYVPLGTSRKFWYRDELSAPLSSITTPGQDKRLYLDPRLLPLLEGRRVALIDDVISTGASITAAIELLARARVEPMVIGAAMLQSERWRERPSTALPDWQYRVMGVFRTPVLSRTPTGEWYDPLAV
jgi:adenine/guanine phosphoribosyltransferase-like PRPP-binding protein